MARKRRGAVLRLCALLLAIAALSCYFLTLKMDITVTKVPPLR